MHFGPQVGPGPQSRERADQGFFADLHADLLTVHVGEWMDHGTSGNAGVRDDAVRADGYAVAQRNAALEHAVDVDLHVLAALQPAAQVEAGRVGQPHARPPSANVRLPQLECALQLRQLQRAVDAFNLQRVGRRDGDHADRVGHGQPDDIGEVVLALRVLVGELGNQRLSMALGTAMKPVYTSRSRRWASVASLCSTMARTWAPSRRMRP